MQVCLYFVNLVLEDYENYVFWHTPDMVERRNMYPHRVPPIREPAGSFSGHHTRSHISISRDAGS